MSHQKVITDLTQVWDDAIQRAAESTPRELEAGADMLNTAAGLHVQSGVQAGKLWSASCGGTCTTCAAGCSNACFHHP
ncbi:MAG TPA: hypothetical protein VFD70_17120 [Anaerolineae bacterium]|nr:hypothetical protein [Anaerolineae bacterium]